MISYNDALAQRWVSIIGELKYFGSKRQLIIEQYNQRFGSENWTTAHLIRGEIKPTDKAIELYEEGYFEFLRTHPTTLEWLVNTASDVYDISPTNVASGFDYKVQECNGIHLQDIAIRRVLRKIGREFKGNRLVQIRGSETEGYVLNPGKVPFHLPDLILSNDNQNWWSKGSIEEFYQNNKALLVNPDKLVLTPAIIGSEGLIFRADKQNYYIQTDQLLRLRWINGKKIRRLCHETEDYRFIPKCTIVVYSEYLENNQR